MLDHFKLALRGFFHCQERMPGNRSEAGRCPVIVLGIMAVFSGGALMSQPAQPATPSAGARANRPTTAVVTNYHGWTKAILLSNGRVEALIGSEAGRVMQFRFAGGADGPFGKIPSSTDHILHDELEHSRRHWRRQVMAAPQSDWPRHAPWSPPFGFDGNPTPATSPTVP